jgi:hypothetical protein
MSIMRGIIEKLVVAQLHNITALEGKSNYATQPTKSYPLILFWAT